MTVRVLVADDDLETCSLLREILTEEGYGVETAAGGREAAEKGTAAPVDVALIDVWMPDLDGLEVLRRVKSACADTIVIMMTAFGSIETAIKAIQEGAYDYVCKPFRLEEIKVTIRRALEQRRLVSENLRFRQELREKYRFENIVGSSERMLEVYKVVARVAPTRSTVLIEGETGTGKELIARAIHYNSPRADSPFVAIDCSALAESLLESELFGHVRGAFTGAVTEKRGLFEVAHGGTCFLDEVGELSTAMQARLLRVLQEQEIKRVGGTENLKVDVRVVAATNKDLSKLVADGAFREDLFYRLSVVTIVVPRLRERGDDIPLLATHFLRKYAALNGKPISHISPEAMASLVADEWPGNVRELEHAIERAVVLTSNRVILPEDLSLKFTGASGKVGSTGGAFTLREVVTGHIRAVLEQAKGNKKLAAQLLGVHRRTLYRLAKRYGIPLGERM